MSRNTIREYISRVNRGNDTITDIAMKCGFSELAVFSRNFKACYGMSASDKKTGCFAGLVRAT